MIYFSNTLKYLNQTTRKHRRKSRIKNDLRAFLVILIESFSVITISWGIPIFLTMYHCHTLYVVSITSCPQIKTSLAIFLFTDLFNSSTNCLLYSLSGKLFRRKFILIIKTIFTCGRHVFWNVKENSSLSAAQQLELQPSNELSISLNHGINSRVDSYRLAEVLTTKQKKKLNKTSKNKKLSDDDASFSIVKISDDNESGSIRRFRLTEQIKKPKNFRTFFINNVPLFNSTKTDQITQQIKKKNGSCSSSSSSGERKKSNGLQRQSSNNQPYSSKIVLFNTNDNQLENVTSL